MTRKDPNLTKPPLDHIPIAPSPSPPKLKRAAIAAVAAVAGIGLLLAFPWPVLAFAVLGGLWWLLLWAINATAPVDE